MVLPNQLTTLRIVLTPVFLFLFLSENPVLKQISLVVYIIAAITDWYDGWLARKFNYITTWGKFMDPLADKILTIMVIIYLYYYDILPSYYFWIIVLRDAIIFIGGIFVSTKIGKVLPSDYLGKFTVLTIGSFIIIVTLGFTEQDFLYKIFFYGSIAFSFASVINYGIRGVKEIKKVENEIL